MLLPIFAIVGIFFIGLALLYRVWGSKSASPQSVSLVSSPEWQALLQQREAFERDLTLSNEAKHDLRQVWTETAAKFQALNASMVMGADTVSKKQRGWMLGGIFLVSAFVFVGLGEWTEEAWRMPNPNALMQMSSQETLPVEGSKHPGDMGNLADRIQALQQKLQENPKDIEKWVLLSRSLAVQRDFPAAADALRKAVALSPEHPDLLADLADIVAMVNGRSLAGEPSELIARALKSDPKHPKALALAATAAMQAGDKAKSLALWTTLRNSYQGKPEDIAKIDEIIAQIKTQSLPQLMAKSGMASATSAPSPSPSPSKTTSETASSPSGMTHKRITGQVVLPSALVAQVKSSLNAQSVLYVFAKLEAGPPMPLAVMKIDPQTLLSGRPVTFTLDETMAMSPQLSLANAEVVKVEARLAFSGNAIKQSGDLSAVANQVAVGAQGVTLTFAASQ